MMTFFFDGVPNPGEKQVAQAVVKRPRRPPYKPPPPPVKFVEVPDLPPPIDWKARYLALPRNDDDEVEWTKALDDKTISLKASIGDQAKEEDDTDDSEVEIATSGRPQYKVVFSHLAHTKWLVCDECHPKIFGWKAGRTKITMDAFDEGRQCGACHGKVAAPDLGSCPTCHVPLRKKKK